MLQVMRKHFQGYVAWVIVGLVCITFAIWGIHNYEGGGQSNTVAATVNGVKITDKQWKDIYQNVQQQQMQQQGGNYATTPAQTRALKKDILDQLITQQVLLSAASAAGLEVPSIQVKQVLESVPAFQQDGKYDPDRVMQWLRANNMTSAALYQRLRNQLLTRQLQAGIVLSDFATQQEVETAMRLLSQRRDIRYVLITAKPFAKHMQVSTQEAEAYYEKHKQDFTVPDQVQLAYVELSNANLIKHMQFSEQALHDYYQNNLDHFSSPSRRRIAQILVQVAPNATAKQFAAAQKKAQNIYQQLKAGGNFANLAKRDSDDIATKNRGGDMGWWQKNNPFGTAFNQAVGQLNQLGDISTPIRTKYGFNIIKLTDMQAAKHLPFVKVKQRVRQVLAQDKAQQQFPELSERLSDLSFTHSDTLENAAKALNLPIQKTALFGKKGGKTMLTKNASVIKAAFSAQVLKENYNSDVININDSTAVVVRLLKRVPSHIPAFKDIAAQVKEKIIAKRSKAKANTVGKNIAVALKKQQVAMVKQQLATANLQWKTSKSTTRMSETIAPLVNDMAFSMPRPSKKHASISGKALPNGDYLVVEVLAVQPGDKKYNAQKFTSYQQIVATNNGGLNFMLYQQALRKQANVKLKDQSFLEG